MTAECAQHLAAFLRHEGVLAACARDNRLMQVPAGSEHVWKLWTAHEGRVITVPPANLLHRATKQDHGVGRFKASRRLESEFALARAELDFDRAQGQAEREDVAPDDIEYGLHFVITLFRQILVAMRKKTYFRRLAGLARMLRRYLRVFEFENMKFDFEAGHEVEFTLCQFAENRSVKVPRCERHRPPIGEIDIA